MAGVDQVARGQNTGSFGVVVVVVVVVVTLLFYFQ